jgi:hypothetical protein
MTRDFVLHTVHTEDPDAPSLDELMRRAVPLFARLINDARRAEASQSAHTNHLQEDAQTNTPTLHPIAPAAPNRLEMEPKSP